MMEFTHITTPTADAVWFIADLARVHVDGDRSSGAFGLVEMTKPAGDMSPLHVHHHDDETFYVLEGELSLFAGDEHVVLTAGQAFLAPRGVPHTYRAETDVRSLVIGAPAGFEQFVRAAGSPADALTLPPADHPVDPEALARTAAEYGIEILGPPGMLPTEVTAS
jgi:mannose-6-phosphate isomerase-like protein (cupin superfamily)